ncbi:peptide/nickel transport system substrate-binding protein [Granulicella aggregans]|uniref:Peptide/nickel transport system substrate-binding protein n=1 Tax=Granulicella aggregans TaxID=474949 RepID=A0A7W8E3V5_9BACT|nr:ABC transporter substrate-binding protein [Granulicella aggregans]MBB5057977.1 peptide/nickel transport system substrate-binding protein [Granulicella aggregans]
MMIESSPNNLDLRVGTDAQSERIGGLVFDALVKKDEHYDLQPWLATSWEQPDPLTWIFHLRDGVQFHDGRALSADDVVWTIESLIDPAHGNLITSKSGNFASVTSAEARDRLTVVVHLKHADAGLLFNMSDGLFGVVPNGSGRDFGLHPIGTGPFRFISGVQDKEVLVERNPGYWAGEPKIERVRFAVVPDAITTALELQKGSGDLESNAITLDMVHALRNERNLATETGPSSVVVYMNFNVQDPILRDRRVRQAIACAIDRQAIVDAIWRGKARLANSLLPPEHWARAADSEMASYPHDIDRAQRLLGDAGFPARKDGIRLHLTLKTSTDETTRLMAAILQQQVRSAGIDLQIRSAEFGTFYSDVTKGVFQIYALRWIGSNEDPDIFRYAYGSASFPPKGGNRGRYSNPRLDALLQDAAGSSDQSERRKDYVEIQQILAEDLPGIPLWYPDNEVIHSQRVDGIKPIGAGDFDYLRSASLRTPH